MKESMYKKGDEVSIVPNDNHPQFVKDNYDKVLKVVRVIKPDDGNYLYKVGNIKDFALESDLVALIPRTDKQLDRFNEVYKDYPFKLSDKKINVDAITNLPRTKEMKAKIIANIANYDFDKREQCFGIAFQVKKGYQYCKYIVGYQNFPLQSDAERILECVQNELNNLSKEQVDLIMSQPFNKHQYVNI